MGRACVCVSVILLGITAAHSQQPTELRLASGSDNAGTLHAPVFSKSGNHLFTFANPNRIRVHRTSDGVLIREIDLPIHSENSGFPAEVNGFHFAGRLSLASAGKKLVVNARAHTSDRNELVIWLVDTEAFVGGQDVMPTAITVPMQPKISTVSFVCSMDSDRLIFVDTNFHTATSRLVVYDLERKMFDSGASVKLDAITSIEPNYLSMYSMINPFVYLLGMDENSDFLALRVTPAKGPNNLLAPQSCSIEKLRIRWNERGYSTIDVVDRGTLPTLPVTVSPTLSHYLCATYSQRSSTVYAVTIGLDRIAETNQRPTPVRQILAEVHRPVEYWAGTWSGDGQVFFVGDGNETKRRRLTAISFHDRSGTQLGLIPTGEAHSADVLAISHDGRFVVTHRKLRLHSNRTSNRKKHDNPHEYQAWELK